MAHGRIEPMGRLVRSWRKLTCERLGGIRVLTPSRPRMCSATGRLVAEPLVYPLTCPVFCDGGALLVGIGCNSIN
jgi:hypothetical protein